MLPLIGIAQSEDVKEEKVKEKLARPTFASSAIIDNQSSTLYNKGSFEVQMQHRFGLVTGTNDLVGFWGRSNIRIGVAYSILDRLSVGFGTTKDKRLQDFNLKGAILQQTRSGSIPLSITYYGNATISALPKSSFNNIQDRYSFFNQIIVSRRFSSNFSLQVAGSLSHQNAVPPTMENDVFGIAVGAKIKVSPGTNILIDYSQPLVSYQAPPTPNPLNAVQTPKPGISLGFEFNTSAHAFQLIATNNWGIVPQENYMFNQNDFFKGDILIGFNITRIYNF